MLHHIDKNQWLDKIKYFNKMNIQSLRPHPIQSTRVCLQKFYKSAYTTGRIDFLDTISLI